MILVLIIASLAAVLVIFSAALLQFSAFFAWHLHKNQVIRLMDIGYLPGSSHPKHRLDVYLPNRGSGPYPVIHFSHGGYWHSGDKNLRSWLTGLYGVIGVTLARHGIATVVSNYRLVPEVAIDGQLQDVAASINWTLQAAKDWHWYGRLFAMGHSAGGHLAGLLALSPKLASANNLDTTKIAGYIGLSPILDIPNMIAVSSTDFNKRVSQPTFGKDASRWPTYSPTHYIQQNDLAIPLLILYGRRDYPAVKQQAQNVLLSSAKVRQLAGYSHAQMVSRFGQKHDLVTRHILKFVTSTID